MPRNNARPALHVRYAAQRPRLGRKALLNRARCSMVSVTASSTSDGVKSQASSRPHHQFAHLASLYVLGELFQRSQPASESAHSHSTYKVSISFSARHVLIAGCLSPGELGRIKYPARHKDSSWGWLSSPQNGHSPSYVAM
jgi:hypothetical protein